MGNPGGPGGHCFLSLVPLQGRLNSLQQSNREQNIHYGRLEGHRSRGSETATVRNRKGRPGAPCT